MIYLLWNTSVAVRLPGKEDCMKQSNNNKKSRDVTAFLYERLSRDDNMDGESYSIENQKKLLIKVAKEKGYTNLVHFFDDGISGVTMDRPGFADMIQQLEQGKAAAVFVKDLSRLGRNYIEVGRLTEEFFPNHDIRLVAVSDNIDTDEGENELAPIRNLFNEWYARDISKKRRISNKIKGNAGEPMGQPPYGYIKDPENPKRWIVDEEAAQVVRRIYRMTLEGVGTEQIAAKLEEDGILTPRAYWHSKGINRPGKVKDLPPTHWNSSSVIKMLSVQEYCGDILNFKTYSKSYKNKKRLENDRENWAIFKDVHEPIIERAVFEQVQQKRGKMRKRQAKDGERSMFSGLLVCADCGSNLHFHFNQGNPEIKYFNCSNYKGNRGTCGSNHYVRVDFLEQVVLGEIRRLTKYAGLYEDDFLKEVIGHSRQAEETERRLKEKELKSLLARDDELDGLFERIYEDNVSGKLSDDRFAKMSRRYEEEQKELSEKIKKLRSEIEKQNSRAASTDMFVSIVRKYTRARKLTPRMLNELVEKIEVYNAERIDGEWVQRLRIHYNCVGEMNIPNEPTLPIPAVTVNTRKGVFVSYTTDDRPAV
ncbi:MAG: recombinase family protein [Eubacteriales bacterium]|nr:recombinase family protein [Eubacteriales bacterium]